MTLDDYDRVFQEAGTEWNVDPRLLKSVAQVESGGRANARSKVGAQGVMQIMPDTGRGLGAIDLNDPVQSIWAGAKYLSQGLDAEKSPEDALRFYHGGPGWRAKYGQESRAYVPLVTAAYQRTADPGKAVAMAQTRQVKTDPIDDFLSGKTDPAPAAAPAKTAAPAAPDAVDDFLTGKAGPEPLAQEATAKPAAPPPETTVSGVGKNIAAGALDAAGNVINTVITPAGNLIGNPLATGLVFAHDALAPYLGYQPFPNDVRNMLLNNQVPQPGSAAIGAVGNALNVNPDAVPANTETERLARKVAGGTLTAAALGPAGVAAPVAGAAGTVAGDIAAKAAPEWAKPAAELAGNVVGAGVVGAGAAAVRPLRGTAGGVAPETAQLAQLARDKYGIPINAPQMSDSSVVKIANDQSKNLPFSGAAKSDAAIQSAWQRAVIKQTGENADVATPEVMSHAATRIGGVFNDTAARTNIVVDQTPLIHNLGDIETEASKAPLGAGGHADIKSLNDLIVTAAADGNGTISGQAYQQLTRKGAPLDRAMSAADPNVRHYAGRIKESLDDAFQQSASPEGQAALTTARSQWRAMKTIEDMVEKSPDGNLSPALLMGQVRSASSRFDGSTGGMAYTGGGELGDLARIGQKFLKTPPNSGTADRAAVNLLVGGAGGGSIVSAAMGHPLTLASVPAGLIANRLVGAYLRGGGLAGRVIDSSLNGPRPIPNPLVSGVASDMEAERRRNALNR